MPYAPSQPASAMPTLPAALPLSVADVELIALAMLENDDEAAWRAPGSTTIVPEPPPAPASGAMFPTDAEAA